MPMQPTREGLSIADLVLLKLGWITTTSGKLRRSASVEHDLHPELTRSGVSA